nr:sugar transferase [Leptolyngbya sp. FACHB-60]
MKVTGTEQLTGHNKLLALAGKKMTTIGQWLTESFGVHQKALVSDLVVEASEPKRVALAQKTDLPTEERLRLPRLLNGLPPSQFEELVFALNPSAGIVSANTAPQGNRAIEFLAWIEGPTGPGFGKLYEVLEYFGINDLAPPQAGTVKRLSFAFAGNIDKVNYAKLKAVVALLQDMAEDTSISILDIEEGSIKLTLGGSSEGLAKLKALFDEKELTEIADVEVLDVSFLPTQLDRDWRSSSPSESLTEMEMDGQQGASPNNSKHQIGTSLLPTQTIKEDGRTGDLGADGVRLSSSHTSDHPSHPSIYNPWKRSLDVIGSVIGLSFLIVIFIPIAIVIKIDSPGPIFHRQTRCGLHGRPFHLWKLRTMVANADALKHSVSIEGQGLIFKNENDPRVTRVGRFLRHKFLNEFPSLWNVLKGDMSLVGPRPPTLEEVAHYTPRQWKRLDVKPGITGQWQLEGRASIKNFEEVVLLDLKYQEQWTLLLDLKLIWKTLVLLFDSIPEDTPVV